MTRAIICVLDSFGIGGAPDAAAYGDAGANTLGHIANFCAAGRADQAGFRAGPLHVPNMAALGLGLAGRAASGEAVPGLENAEISGLWGHARETSAGKDTPSGHWEICGVPVPFAWHGFPQTIPSFPQDITEALIREGQLPGILGDCHASGTEIIARFGEEHLRTGKPILYTSLDSVMQIAAHEETFGLERLYSLCIIARRLLDPLNVGRVIARPFLGDTAQTFKRTPNRKDWSVPPIAPTLLDHCAAAHIPVTTIGKIGDIFAHHATGREIKAAGNMALFDRLIEIIEEPTSSGFIFANFVDFDTEFGHRRDVAGYALALEAFDRRLPELAARLRPGDMCILTADHGCDPTWPGTDHTREQVPVLAFGPGIGAGSIGARESFADIGASAATWLGLPALAKGTSFLEKRTLSPALP